MTHALKTNPPYYDQVASGDKTFELRKDDRPFAEGDTLLLQEYNDGMYTGKELTLKITAVLRDYKGLYSGYCIISFTPLTTNQKIVN